MPRDYFLNSGPRLNAVNDDGQPIVSFPAQHLNNAAKALEELSNICTGILCDGELNDMEATFFKEWIGRHLQFANIAWFSDLRQRLSRIFADDIIDDTERNELREIMELIRGGNDLQTNYSSPLPLNTPPPVPIQFQGLFFCITGKFAFGKRTKVIEAITLKGGFASDSQPAQRTNYLIIGKFVSRDWREQSYGTKIERAVQLRSQGHPIAIVSEDHWRSYIQ